jgi:GntR family transcriptional regulator
MTARNAMQRLAEDGLIERHPGRGSFVAEPSPHRRANRLMTFSQEMLRRGRVPTSRLLTRVIRPSTVAEATSLGIPARQPIVHLRRLRMADDEPIAVESAVLVRECAEAVMTADLVHGSLHETLARAGFELRRGTGTIAAAAATSEEARLLGIRTGDPLLVEERVIVDGRGQRIESTRSVYSADRYGLDVQFDIDASNVKSGDGEADTK